MRPACSFAYVTPDGKLLMRLLYGWYPIDGCQELLCGATAFTYTT